MSQISAPVVVYDGKATPVAQTFHPERVAPELSTFVERTSGVSAGYKRISIGFSPASTKRPTNRIDVSFDFPVLGTTNGVSTVAYVARFKGYFVIPDTMTAAERKDFFALGWNALNTSPLTGVVRDLDPLY